MTATTDVRRARVIDEALGPVLRSPERLATALTVRRELCGIIARAIRASDEAAGMVLVPREALNELIEAAALQKRAAP